MAMGSGAWGLLVRCIALPALVLAAIVVQSSIEVGALTVDPVTRGNLPPWTGALSTTGVLLWCIGATCGIAAGTRREPRDATWAACARSFGFLAAWLCVDDAFLVHDAIGPRYLGIPELAIIGAEGVWLGVLILRHRLALRARESILFCAAIGFFGGSVLSDSLPAGSDVPGLWRLSTYIVEDGFKWLGICTFTTWLVRLSLRTISR